MAQKSELGNRKSKFFSEIGRKKTSEIGIPTHLRYVGKTKHFCACINSKKI
uniref:Uncharacterized protein n=1 Tax=Meloidogyne enterolobii TaxID=390850 RepID=A0A6V7W2Q7_MELEN|nr:unnamed protein product [Meloidogyne enterolobii]